MNRLAMLARMLTACICIAVFVLVLSQRPEGQQAKLTAAPTTLTAVNTAAQPSDEMSPPGCLVVVGADPPSSCQPCPPLWLGGPTIRCISGHSLSPSWEGSASGFQPPSPLWATGFQPPSPLWGRLGRGCPLVSPLAAGMLDSRMYQRLCGTGLSAGE